MMKVFIQGGLVGLILSVIAAWVLKLSPWALQPDLKFPVFVMGGALLGGLFNLLIGNRGNVSSR